jgi:hypothetical protein
MDPRFRRLAENKMVLGKHSGRHAFNERATTSASASTVAVQPAL